MDQFHLVKEGRAWRLENQNSVRTTKIFNGLTKEQAIEESAQFLRDRKTPASLAVHKMDGTIEEERTFPLIGDPP